MSETSSTLWSVRRQIKPVRKLLKKLLKDVSGPFVNETSIKHYAVEYCLFSILTGRSWCLVNIIAFQDMLWSSSSELMMVMTSQWYMWSVGPKYISVCFKESDILVLKDSYIMGLDTCHSLRHTLCNSSHGYCGSNRQLFERAHELKIWLNHCVSIRGM